jgi:tripartite-type tricarboxylate transporter receptor subunit TctC
LIVSAQGGASDTEIMPRAINAVLGTKMKIVTGYSGSAAALLALERGEVNGYFTGGWAGVRNTVEPWLKTGKVKLLVQLSVRKSSEFPDVPLIMDFAATEKERRILELAFASQVWGRPYAAPPEIPAERANDLRKAFAETLIDPAFVSEIEKLHFTIDPLTGEEMSRMISEVYAVSPDIVAATRAALSGQQ